LKARLKAASEEAGPVSSSDDSRLLAVGSHKRVTVWDLKKHKELFEFKEPAKQVDAILFLPGGKRLLGVARDGSAWEWDLTTGKVARTSGQLGRMTSGFCVSADRRTVFALKGLPNTVQLMVNTADLSTQAIEVAWSGSIRAPAVSPDGKQLILGESEEVKLYDVERRKTEKVHHLHTKWISPAGIDVHWESKLVASGSEDHTAVVWDLKVGKERFTCKGFDGPVGVQFSPDGKTLFAWADNGTRLRRWDVASGKELQPVDGHDGGIRWAGFRSGGSRRTLIVYEHDGKVTFYDLSGLSE
jgi:WD40 repeat protein